MSFDGSNYPSDEGFDLSTKGQIHTHDASGNAALNVGANTTILTADSTESSGMKWAAASAGATLTSQEISPTASQTTTSTSLTDMTGTSSGLAKTTLASRTAGKALCVFFANIEMSVYTNQYNVGFEIDGTDENITSNHGSSNNTTSGICLSEIFALNGQVLQLRWRVAAGTATLANGATTASRCSILEIS